MDLTRESTLPQAAATECGDGAHRSEASGTTLNPSAPAMTDEQPVKRLVPYYPPHYGRKPAPPLQWVYVGGPRPINTAFASSVPVDPALNDLGPADTPAVAQPLYGILPDTSAAAQPPNATAHVPASQPGVLPCGLRRCASCRIHRAVSLFKGQQVTCKLCRDRNMRNALKRRSGGRGRGKDGGDMGKKGGGGGACANGAAVAAI